MGTPIGRLDAPRSHGAWRVWLPNTEQDPREGNPCFGIALAVLLSLPIWAVFAVLTFSFRF